MSFKKTNNENLNDSLIIEEFKYLQANKLIAKYMGWETGSNTVKVPNLYPVYNINDSENTGWIETKISELEFNIRWDWLMPVIEKISLCVFEDGSKDTCYPRTFGMVDIETAEFMFRFNRYSLHRESTLIKAGFEAVIEVLSDLCN